jgi:hypothetical protein
MPPVEFEPTISAGERPQTYNVDRAAIGIGDLISVMFVKEEYEQNMLQPYRRWCLVLVQLQPANRNSLMHGRQSAKLDFRIIAIIIIVVIVVTVDFFHRLATRHSPKSLVGKYYFRITWCVYIWGIVSKG